MDCLSDTLNKGLGRYLSISQLDLIQTASVGIAGVGGLGSNVAMLLTRCGVRQFTLVDFDKVEISNLNRQFYFPDQVGLYKVDALAENLLRINPDLDLTLEHQRLTNENIIEIFSGCQVIVEAFDNAQDKAMCYRTFRTRECFYVSASGLAGWANNPMSYRSISPNISIVGDFSSLVKEGSPPMAPRVMQAASMQANAVLAYILQ